MWRWIISLAAAIVTISCSPRQTRSPVAVDESSLQSAAALADVFANAPGLETVQQVDTFGYREQYQRRLADGVREGRYLRFNADGQRVEEAFYRNDTLHGPRIFYFPGGDTLSIEQYRMGLFEGEFRQYYENGQLQLSGMYRLNEMSGEWRQYYDSGELKEVVTFQDNAENGPFVEYFRNGNLKAEGNYLNGDHEHGLLKLYDETGRLVRKMDCDKGKCRTVWRAEGEEEEDVSDRR